MSKAGAIEIDISEHLDPEQLAEFDKLSPSDQMDVVAAMVQDCFDEYQCEEALRVASQPKRERSGQLLLF